MAFLELSRLSTFTIFTNTTMQLVNAPNFSVFSRVFTVVPREIEDNGFAKFWGVNKVHYGLC